MSEQNMVMNEATTMMDPTDILDTAQDVLENPDTVINLPEAKKSSSFKQEAVSCVAGLIIGLVGPTLIRFAMAKLKERKQKKDADGGKKILEDWMREANKQSKKDMEEIRHMSDDEDYDESDEEE